MGIPSPAYTVFACSLMFFWNIGFRMVFFALVPIMARDIGFSTGQAGLLVGVFYLGYSLSVWGSAFIPGKRKPMIVAGAFITLLFLLLMTKTRSFSGLMVWAPLCGAGAGFYLPRGLALLADASEDSHRGRNISIHEIAAVLGMMLGPLSVSKLMAYWNWDTILNGWGLSVLIAVLVLLGVADNSPVRASRTTGHRIRPDKIFFSLTVVGGSIFLIIVGFTSVLPLIMVNVWQINAAYAASYLGLTRLAGILGPLIGGILSDRWGRIRILLIFCCISMLALVAMMFNKFGWVFTSLLLLMTITSNGSTPVWATLVTESYPPEEKDKAFGVISGSASLLGSVLSPSIFGMLIDAFPLPVTFAVAALGTLGGIWILRRIPYLNQNRDRRLPTVGLDGTAFQDKKGETMRGGMHGK